MSEKNHENNEQPKSILEGIKNKMSRFIAGEGKRSRGVDWDAAVSDEDSVNATVWETDQDNFLRMRDEEYKAAMEKAPETLALIMDLYGNELSGLTQLEPGKLRNAIEEYIEHMEPRAPRAQENLLKSLKDYSYREEFAQLILGNEHAKENPSL